MTDLPPYSRKPVTLPDGTPVIGWSELPAHRCWCGRPVGRLSACDCCCAEHDSGVAAAMQRHPAGKAIPARFDERYDPSPEPIDRKIQ